MGNASGHIEQQLSKLQTQTADIATELESLVDSYLQILSQASKRQLVLAAYHVCTQIYPERFLDLSLSQRDRLQQRLRELGNSIQSQFEEKWQTAKKLSLRPAEEDGLAVIRQLFLEAASLRDRSGGADDAERKSDNSSDELSDEAPLEEQTSADEGAAADTSQEEQLLAEIRTLVIGGEELDAVSMAEDAEEEPLDSGSMQPAQLMRRQILIEKAIRDVLKAISEQANEVLQAAHVMPEMPQALLNAASESERLGHIPMKTPNLVKLAIKIVHEPGKGRLDDDDEQMTDDEENGEESEQWSEEAEITAAIITGDDSAGDDEADRVSDDGAGPMPRLLQLESLPNFVMIHLRLSEIEFAEANVAVWRNRIRKKMAHLKRVGHAYKSAEKQLAIAQAEDAWRSSWTND
ncbi:hypothetical protein [Leptothoe kymatousa]|uniref:Uncharacterized protein n=1 Tax=Leptothoe kymatousa TAU-MAC 1615 TaxID=2364775 RepID=A0ABS5Y415_9CYAN|nr:hypothetical protein [Leptothoe kymatousa]MBT9312588.1 hypothetical protein [Leptothoe kymatousa TAU-MAC 1615]